MRPTQFHAKDLEKLLRRKTVATMSQLKAALGTRADATVFRKLKELPYLTSYSHGGRYYTLKDIPSFNELGLWSFHAAHFSRYRTLLSTIEAFAEECEAGLYEPELAAILDVSVKEAVVTLVRQGRVTREKVAGRYLYCAVGRRKRRDQALTRKHRAIDAALAPVPRDAAALSEEAKAAIVLFTSLLDEQQRRLYAGLESLKLGYGGDPRVAAVLNLDVSTVARGRRELEARDVEVDRVRRAGAGRKSLEKKPRRSSRKSSA